MILSLVQWVHIPFIDKVKKTDESFDSSVLRGSIISVVGKTTVELIELFECRQKVP